MTALTAPEGFKLVPIEPTDDMVVMGFESAPHQGFCDPDVWDEYDAMSGCQKAAHRAKLCYAAMLAAAPEVDLSGDYVLLRAAAKDLFNKSFADPEVTIGSKYEDKRDNVQAAVLVFQAVMRSTAESVATPTTGAQP